MIQRSSIAFTPKSLFLRSLGFLLFCLLLSNNLLAQKPNYSPLVCTVLNYDFMTKEGEVVTNVLSVKNQNGIAREFYLEIGCPSDWKVLTSSKRVYNIEPNDSIFIPIRLLPNLVTMKGSTKYNVTVFVVGTDGRTHAVCSFQVGKPRRVDWDMKVLPRSRIYFLNDQYEANLGINISNNGEEAQDVNLSWKIFGQGLTLKSDSLKSRSFLDFLVASGADTVINFRATLLEPKRNIKRIDLENYRPSEFFDARKYSIYFRGSEPKNVQGRSSRSVSADVVKLNSSVDFIKLSNNYTVNSYGSSVLPITWHSNLYNILGYQPIWMNIFNLDMPLKENSYLRANIQHVFSFYTPGSYTLRNFSGMASYSSKNLIVSIGGIGRLMIPIINGSNVIGQRGTGISASYRISKNFLIAASGSISPGLISNNYSARSFSLGSSYNTDNNDFQAALGFSRSKLLQLPINTSDYMTGFKWRFVRNHNIFVNVGLNRVNQNVGLPNQSSLINWNWIFVYNGNFLENRLNQSFTAQNRQLINVFSGQINNSLSFQSQTAVQFTKSFNTNISIAYLQNNTVIGPVSYSQTSIPINLSFGVKNLGNFVAVPSLFYLYTETELGKLHFRGINLNKSYTDLDQNFRLSASLLAGYNKFKDSLNYPELFTANTFLMVAWRTLSANVRYNYGPLGLNTVKNFHYNGSRYPQYIFSSLSYQYVFKANRFVSEWVLNHSWNNQTYSNNVNFGPQLFYFTKNRWRFDVRFLYNFSARNNDRAAEFYEYQGYSNIPEPEERITVAGNFNLSFGIKKEFGVPLPKKWRKVEYVDAHFTAFLDFNGNKVMDNDEVPLENIVIKVNGHEVLTDKDGKGKFVNIPVGTYEHKIIPLVDLDGWFTYTMDSIDIVGEQYYVPFTRGVKVAGSIVLDREKFTKDVLSTIDLSGIKIFTTDTLGNTMATMTDFNGNFSFYVPYGAYILSMDEEVIGDRFYIAQNHIPMDLYDGMDGFYQSFFIIEKRRTVKKKKFNEKGELIMVEEVDGGADRNNNNTTINNYEDSTVIHNNNNTYNIFNEDRKGNGGTNVNADDLYRELDERIDRLDAIIRALLKGEITDDNRKVLAEALRQLKNEEEAKRLNGAGPQPVMETMDASRHFHLVVGGFVYRENAERFVAKLKAQGFDEAVIIGVFNGYFLVRLKDYSTLQEAIEAQQKYKYVDKGLWVHKWP